MTLVSALEAADTDDGVTDDVGVSGCFGRVKGCCDLGICCWHCCASCVVRLVE